MRIPASPGTHLAAYPIHTTITTRVSDMDGYGHLNAIRLGQFYEEARANFYMQAFDKQQRDTRILVAELTFQYLGEGFWPGAIEMGTGIAQINSSSFLMGQGLFQNGELLGMCKTVLVCTRDGKSCAIPDEMRSMLARQSIKTTETA